MTSERKCVAPGCSAEPPSETELFSFPLQTSLVSVVHKGKTVYYSRRKVWLNRLGVDESCLDKHSAVCSLHFRDEDYSSEKGVRMLKENAVPSKNLPSSDDCSSFPFDFPQKMSNEEAAYDGENEIETVEKSDDDDDDVEIIEPQREVITLDDDDFEEEASKEPEKATETQNPGMSSDKSLSEPKKTLVLRTVTEKELNGRKLIPLPKGLQSPFKVLKLANSAISNQETGQLPMALVTSDGKKYTVQAPLKPGPPRQVLRKPNEHVGPDGKLIKLKTVRTLKAIDKKSPVYKLQLFSGKNGDNLSDKEVSEAVKEQLCEIVQNRPGLRKTLEVDKIGENIAKVPVKIVSPTELKNLKLTPVPSDLVKRTLKNVENFEKRKRKEPVPETIPSPNKKFKIKSAPDFRRQRAPFKQVPTESTPSVGFTEIYDFINEQMINFAFEIFGTKYILRSCNLNFEAYCGSKKSRKTADISDSSLSSTDPFLLNGMNVSLGMSNKSLNCSMFTKTIKHKYEKIDRIEEEHSGEVPVNFGGIGRVVSSIKPKEVKDKRKNKRKQFIETRVDTPESTKIILHPIMPGTKIPSDPVASEPKAVKVNKEIVKNKTDNRSRIVEQKKDSKVIEDKDCVTEKNDSAIEKKDGVIEKRRVLKKKRNLDISRKLLNMAISQMNPTLRGRFLVPNTKFKKNRKVVLNNVNPKRTVFNLDTGTASESSAQGSLGDPTSPKKDKPAKATRRSVSKVKNYKNLNSFGTTDETVVEEITMGKKKKTTAKPPRNAKRMKYSEKVGHIESFLEVVLEPDNKANEMMGEISNKDPLDPMGE